MNDFARIVVASLGVISAIASGSVQASDLVYRPQNPSFGGNPLLGGHLTGLATAQRDPRSVSRNSSFGRDPGEQFVRQLQSRLLSELARQVEQAIFGEAAENSGVITFGDQTIRFERGLEFITLNIVNTATGEETEINVPVLQLESQ